MEINTICCGEEMKRIPTQRIHDGDVDFKDMWACRKCKRSITLSDGTMEDDDFEAWVGVDE